MNIRAKVFGEASQLLVQKQPKGVKADMLHSIPVSRSEARRGNQRANDRHRLEGESAWLRHGGEKHEVEVLNLSGEGAMIRSDLELVLWDEVGLVLGEGGEIDCAVRWIKDDKYGLEFAFETRIDCSSDDRDNLLRQVIRKSFPEVSFDPLAEPNSSEAQAKRFSPGEFRAAERHPLAWNGTLFHALDSEQVRLRNISGTGVLVQSDGDLPVGETCYLDLGKGERIEGTVCWSRGGQSGIRFTEPFDVAKLAEYVPELAPGARSGMGRKGPGWNRVSLNEMARSLGG